MSACVPAMRLASADTNTASGMAFIPGRCLMHPYGRYPSFVGASTPLFLWPAFDHTGHPVVQTNVFSSSSHPSGCLYVLTYITCSSHDYPETRSFTNVKTVDSPKAYSTFLALIEEGTAAVCSCASLPLREMMESKYGKKLRT